MLSPQSNNCQHGCQRWSSELSNLSTASSTILESDPQPGVRSLTRNSRALPFGWSHWDPVSVFASAAAVRADSGAQSLKSLSGRSGRQLSRGNAYRHEHACLQMFSRVKKWFVKTIQTAFRCESIKCKTSSSTVRFRFRSRSLC